MDYAVRIANKTHAEIVLLHAYQIIDTESPTRKLLFEEYNYNIAGKLRDELNIQRKKIARINLANKITADLSDNPTRKAIIEASTDVKVIKKTEETMAGIKNPSNKENSVTAAINKPNMTAVSNVPAP